ALSGPRSTLVIHLHGEFKAHLLPHRRLNAALHRMIAVVPRTIFVSNIRGLTYWGRTTIFVPNRLGTEAARLAAAHGSCRRSPEPSIAFVGAIIPSKGADTLLEAVMPLPSAPSTVLVGPVVTRLGAFE